MIVSLLKMIALAFIYPLFISEAELENEDVSVYSLKQEILKAIVNSLDLACLVFYFNYTKWSSTLANLQARVYAAGLGWAFFTLFSGNIIRIVGMRNTEGFVPEFLVECMFANVEFV
mmetsp:Transcript_6516/g.4641  ORF Transcript_6516/g.4641 Transcript_6516/m.4641 type:complete len:117 (-) Transcript_6516:333-683(-)